MYTKITLAIGTILTVAAVLFVGELQVRADDQDVHAAHATTHQPGAGGCCSSHKNHGAAPTKGTTATCHEAIAATQKCAHCEQVAGKACTLCENGQGKECCVSGVGKTCEKCSSAPADGMGCCAHKAPAPQSEVITKKAGCCANTRS